MNLVEFNKTHPFSAKWVPLRPRGWKPYIYTVWEASWSLLRRDMLKVGKCATFHDSHDFREGQRILPKITFPCEDVASAADRTSKGIKIPLVL